MMRAWFMLAVCSVALWKPCSSQYFHETHLVMARKLKNMGSELVKDVEMKVLAVQFYRDQYYKSLAYQLGEMVYQMRYKFKRMVFLFSQAEKDLSYDYRRHTLNVHTMIQIYQKGIEIDNVARMVEEFESNRENTAAFHARMKRVMVGEVVLDRDPGTVRMRQLLLRATRHAKPSVAAAAAAALLRTNNNKHKKKNKKWRHVVDDDFA